MSKSIMHDKKDGTCYLCMKLHDDYSRKPVLQEHHVIFGRGLRRLSEHYGLKVYLCIPHHLYEGGTEAVHRNVEVRRFLDAEGQRAFEKTYPHLVFSEIFGKNVLLEDAGRQQAYEDEAARQQPCDVTEGFMALDNPVPPPEW